jgi:hypothetical protein
MKLNRVQAFLFFHTFRRILLQQQGCYFPSDFIYLLLGNILCSLVFQIVN